MLKYIPRGDRPLFFVILALVFTMLILPWSQVLVPGRDTDGYGKASQEEQDRHEPVTVWEWATDDPVAFFTLWIAAFTAVLAWATLRLHKATVGIVAGAERQERHFQRAERAYVTISHKSHFEDRPGMSALSISDNGEMLVRRIVIKNHGRTPADVIGGRICWEITAEGHPPLRTDGGRKPLDFNGAFLVTRSLYGFEYKLGSMTGEERAALNAGTSRLWIFGYVDYRTFRKVYRGGYGRVLLWNVVGNNLGFADSDLNYDEERKDSSQNADLS